MKIFPTSRSPLCATSDSFRVRCLWRALSAVFALITWPVTGVLAQGIDDEWRCRDAQMEEVIDSAAGRIWGKLNPGSAPNGLAKRDNAMGTSEWPALAWTWEQSPGYAVAGGVFESEVEARNWWNSLGLDQHWNLNNDAVGYINFSEATSWGRGMFWREEITEGTLKARGAEGLGIDGDLWGIRDRFVFHIGPLFFASYLELEESINLQRESLQTGFNLGRLFESCLPDDTFIGVFFRGGGDPTKLFTYQNVRPNISAFHHQDPGAPLAHKWPIEVIAIDRDNRQIPDYDVFGVQQSE